MKILAPASSANEAAALITMGAGEIYCGLQLKRWNKRYGSRSWMNRRGQTNASVQGLKELLILCETAHKKNVPVFLTLNMPYYSPEQYAEIVALVKEVMSNCGVDAFIMGDPGLILAVKESCPEAEIHVSSVAPVLNSMAAVFFKNLGASRIIFPRYLSLSDLKTIMKKVGNRMEYEVFVLNDGCVFEEGYCNVSHAFGGSLCNQPWVNYTLIKEGNHGKITQQESFNLHFKDYRKWLWFVRNCNGGVSPKGYPLGMCGICAIPEFIDMGVDSLKIVGREAPLTKKTSSVKLVKKAIDYIKSCGDGPVKKTMLQEIRGTNDLCKSTYMCYYR